MDCSIFNKVNNYIIKLESLNLKNNLNNKVKSIGVGVSVEFPDMTHKDNKYKVPIHISILISDKDIMKNNKLENIEDKDILVKMSSIYTVNLSMNEANVEFPEDLIQDYAYFLAQPKIMQEINSLGISIGIPKLTIPPRKFLHTNINE